MENSINKVSILNRVLNNLGINDVEISKRIAEQITYMELKTFLLVFPIDGSKSITSKKEIIYTLLSKGEYKEYTTVRNLIFTETGISLTQINSELISLSEDQYERYYFDVVGFFINRGFSNNEKILNVMRSVSVDDFKLFLNMYKGEKISQAEYAKNIGIGISQLSEKLTQIKEVIKRETGIEIIGNKRKGTQVKPIEEYREEVKDYFKVLGITDSSILETLSLTIKQMDFRVFVLRYPLMVETACKRNQIMENLDISLQMTKKSLERVSEKLNEFEIPFLDIYKSYATKYLKNMEEQKYLSPTERRNRELKETFQTEEISEIAFAISKMDPIKQKLLVSLMFIREDKPMSIKEYSKKWGIPEEQVKSLKEEAIEEARNKIKDIKVRLRPEDKELIVCVVNKFENIRDKRLLLHFFGMLGGNMRHSISDLSKKFSMNEGEIKDLLIKFLRLKNECLSKTDNKKRKNP